jgi:predicted aspartyl protease
MIFGDGMRQGRIRQALGVALALALAGCAAAPEGGVCRMAQVSHLTLEPYDQHLLVGAQINGLPARLIFDTGAFTSTLTPAAVTRLRLDHSIGYLGRVAGIGGSSSAEIVSARTISLGGLHGRNFHFLAADIGFLTSPLGPDGLLSTDLVSKFDIDLDFPDRQAVLYQPIGDCTSPSAFLQGPLYEVPLRPTGEDRRPRVKVEIGGKSFVALIDTGAPRSTIFRRAAARLGLRIADLTADRHLTWRGVGPRPVRAVRHIFAPVTVGDLTVNNMPVDVLDQVSTDEVDMLLGADFQRRVHLWISYSSRTLIMQFPPRPSPKVEAAR